MVSVPQKQYENKQTVTAQHGSGTIQIDTGAVGTQSRDI